MSCVREASPPLQDTDHLRNDMKKKRLLQPFRAIGRILRRKPRPPVISSSNGSVDVVTATLRSSKENFDACEQPLDSNWEPTNKSHSTSHLTDDITDNAQRRTLQSTLLSVSHDSVFTSEQRSPDSGSETSLYVHPTRLGFPHSSVRAELFEVIKKRNLENNVSDDEDLGLPRSPVSNSPTTADPDDMFTKEHIVTKSSQSTCSDGSLLSMGSSEMDEESYCHSSRHSSKLSLHEKRISTGSYSGSNNDRSSTNVSSSGNGTSLSHSAAKHKMAVKPKRNHGAPHKKRQIITSNTLPTTPEVNEENSHKNLPPEDKQSKGNCLNCLRCYCCFKQHREPHQCSQSTNTTTVFDENTRREYFYKKNPVYNEPVEVAEQYGKFLFRHSALHAFKYDQVYDFTRIQRVQRCAGGFSDEAFSVERSKQVPRCGSRIFTKYRTSRVSLRRTKIEASMRKKNIPKETRVHSLANDNKRKNLYQYPKLYYEFILKDLEREAL